MKGPYFHMSHHNEMIEANEMPWKCRLGLQKKGGGGRKNLESFPDCNIFQIS